MHDPRAITSVLLDGQSLTLESFVAVARYHAQVRLAPEAMEALVRSRALAEKIAGDGRVAYGITTGFGDFATVAVSEDMSSQLSTNLILSHCTGTGDPYSEEEARGMMLLRANALCRGISGVRPVLVEMLVEMLNKNVVPYIPQKGSLGASGDLAPLSHMGLVLLGRGQAWYKGELLSGREAMERAGIPVLDTLVSKEGLGITNGTCAMTSVGALHLYDTILSARMADLIASLTLTALTGQLDAFQERMHTVRGHKGQIRVAKNMRLLTEGCEILQKAQGLRVQDAVTVYVNDVFSVAVKQRHIKRLGLALLGIQPVDGEFRKILLAADKLVEAAVRALIVHKHDIDQATVIVGIVHGFDAVVERLLGVVHRNDQCDLREVHQFLPLASDDASF